MGNNVTTTPVETLKIDENNDDLEDNYNEIHNNANEINGTSYGRFNIQTHSQYPEHYENENWNHYGQQYVENNQNFQQNPDENELSIKDRIINELNNSLPDFNDESSDVLSEMKDSKPINDLNVGFQTITKSPALERSLPLLRRSIEENDIEEIYDLESIDSSSKLTLNDVKSDTEEVIQELNKLDLDLEDTPDTYPPNYRKRGQSWSNWDNNVDVDLNAESSLSSFSRPASINDNQTHSINSIKTKSYTAPESRIRTDSAIEWLAREGLELENSLDKGIKNKSNDRRLSRTVSSDLRLNSFEIPGSVASLSSSRVAVNDSESHDKYDDLEKQIINSIENDYIR